MDISFSVPVYLFEKTSNLGFLFCPLDEEAPRNDFLNIHKVKIKRGKHIFLCDGLWRQRPPIVMITCFEMLA